jgi:ABC-type lipoprotein export system ATPase subunit
MVRPLSPTLVARTGARRAPLVLADEPTGELDALGEQRLLDALRKLNQEARSTIVIVTPSSPVAAVADRVVEVRDGRVLA